MRILPLTTTHPVIMVRFAQAVLSIFSLSAWNQATRPEQDVQSALGASRLPVAQHATTPPAKSIAIVGAGSAGIAVLKTIFDLPEDVRTNWRVVLLEQRRDVGGVWLPDPAEPNPPHLPETPLYPLLHTNTPHPTMTYPGFPFPPNTPLFPSHEHVKKYHGDVAEQLNLTRYIQLNSEVHAAGWRGNSTHGRWEVVIHRSDEETGKKEVVRDTFDHLIVGNGHNHYPRIPHFDGAEQWLASSLAGSPKREIFHSIFYRSPEKYANQTVVVVGGGASGRDATKQVGLTAKKVSRRINSPKGMCVSRRVSALPFLKAQRHGEPARTHSLRGHCGAHLSFHRRRHRPAERYRALLGRHGHTCHGLPVPRTLPLPIAQPRRSRSTHCITVDELHFGYGSFSANQHTVHIPASSTHILSFAYVSNDCAVFRWPSGLNRQLSLR